MGESLWDTGHLNPGWSIAGWIYTARGKAQIIIWDIVSKSHCRRNSQWNWVELFSSLEGFLIFKM